MKATAELKMLSVSVLKPAAYNPRKKLKPGDKEYEKIKNSITEFLQPLAEERTRHRRKGCTVHDRVLCIPADPEGDHRS